MTKVSVLKTTFAFVALILLAAGPISLAPLGHSAKNSSVSEARRGQRRSPVVLPLVKPRVLVKKARRELLLYSNDKLIRTYHIGLGLSPLGDKVRAGDRRTPEGNFYIFTKNDKSAFYLSLGLSYPNIAHAERGLRDGLISRSQYETIVRAVKAGKAPPQNTRLGGDIYIHGNGAQSDWTWGCVALENDDIRELFAALSLGTPVVIEP